MKLPFFKETPLWVGAMAAYPYSKGMHARLKMTSRFGEAWDLARVDEEAELLFVPRGLVAPWSAQLDRRSMGGSVNYGPVLIPPRNAEQARVIEESVALLEQGESFVLEASTGFGKGYLGCAIASRLNLKTLVVVTKEDLLNKWCAEAQKFLGLKPEQVGIIQQGVCQADRSFVVAMIHSLAKDKYPDWVKEEFGLVISDEVQRLGADTFSLTAGMFNSFIRLGLSATPKRADGCEFVFEAHIGEIGRVKAKLIPVPPKVLTFRTGWKPPLVRRKVKGQWVQVVLPHEHGKIAHIVKLMAKDPSRNKLIVDFVLQAYAKGRNILVLSELAREHHLNLLHDTLVSRGLPSRDIAFYIGGLSEAQQDLAKTRRVVLGTYAMCAEATDAPWWDTLVMATPRANIIQVSGRILREYEDKREPVIFDLIDDTLVLQDYASKRAKQYLSEELQGRIVALN